MCLQSEQESELVQREQKCLLEAERLRCEREELEAQLLEYQQNVDRLREGQQSVEREKERMEAQQRLLQSWRHNRQSSLPVTIPLDGYKVRRSRNRKGKAQRLKDCSEDEDVPSAFFVSLSQVSNHSRSGSLDGKCSVYENETAVLASLQQNHLHQPANNNQHHCSVSAPKKNHGSSLHGSGYSANVGLSASLYNSLNTLLSQAHNKPPPDGLTYPNYSHNLGCPQPLNDSIQPFSNRVTAQPQRANKSKSAHVVSCNLYVHMCVKTEHQNI